MNILQLHCTNKDKSQKNTEQNKQVAEEYRSLYLNELIKHEKLIYMLFMTKSICSQIFKRKAIIN